MSNGYFLESPLSDDEMAAIAKSEGLTWPLTECPLCHGGIGHREIVCGKCKSEKESEAMAEVVSSCVTCGSELSYGKTECNNCVQLPWVERLHKQNSKPTRHRGWRISK